MIESQDKKINLEYYDKIKNFVPKINKSIKDGDFLTIGKIFKEHWKIKKKLSQRITNLSIDKIYSALLKDKNIVGGKLIGAGGGGFFLIVTKNLKKTTKFLKNKKFNYSKISIGGPGSKAVLA